MPQTVQVSGSKVLTRKSSCRDKLGAPLVMNSGSVVPHFGASDFLVLSKVLEWPQRAICGHSAFLGVGFFPFREQTPDTELAILYQTTFC